jgi:hypothetical protein
MILQKHISLQLGKDSDDAAVLGEGWAGPEGAFRWATGSSSLVTCERPADDGDFVLAVVVTPFPGETPQTEKRIAITVNGRCVREAAIADQRLIACQIPASLLAQQTNLTIQFDHPDAQRPSAVSNSPDDRLLAFMFHGLSLLRCVDTPAVTADLSRPDRMSMPEADALSAPDLMLKFASLGDNCEFGIAQRFVGVEPLGLLRFSAAPLSILVPALTERFSLIDDPQHVEIRLRQTLTPHREYVTVNRHYSIETHAHVLEHEMTHNQVFIREMKKLGILSRLLVDDLRAGRRIFVYKQNSQVDMDAVETLSTVLQSYGPNTLLFVTQQAYDLAVGEVQQIGKGLLRGRIDKFSEYDNAASQPSPIWLDLCRAAYTHWRAGA